MVDGGLEVMFDKNNTCLYRVKTLSILESIVVNKGPVKIKSNEN